jgi:tetratricopeptide (TPR) repeat protein
MKKESSIFTVCDAVTKYSIYALIFLVPIFFLPWTSDALDFNKQALLLVLIFIASFSFMLKILVSGKFKISKSPIHFAAAALFVVYAVSTVFSVNKYGSFWGIPQQLSESMLAIICFFLFYFLISNVFTKENISTSVNILMGSAIIAELFGILQLFGLYILPSGFAKTAAFNTVGSAGSLGLVAAIILPLAIVMLILSKKWWQRTLSIAQILLAAVVLVLINYTIIWWVVILGSAAILALAVMKNDIFDGRWTALPMFFMVVGLFFIILNPQINLLSQKPNEIFLLQKTGFDIAVNSIKEKPIFGSGPGTFAYDFSKFKSPDYSNSALWSVAFNKSSSKVLDNLATTGFLGFLAILAFIAFPIYYLIKQFLGKNKNQITDSESLVSQNHTVVLIGLSVAFFEVCVAYLLYDSNMVIDFLFFFTIAAIVALIYEEKKSYTLKNSSVVNLVVTFVFTLIFIFGIGLLVLDGQRYIADIRYNSALASYQASKTDEGLKNLEAAATMNPQSDVYFRQLSQAYLLGLQNKLKSLKTAATDQEKTDIQNLMANSVNAAKLATDINPQDVNNWSSRGYIYQSLIGIQSDAQTWAISSYDSGLKLDPNNPYLFLQEGNSYLSAALAMPSDQSDQKNQLLQKSQTQLEKATSLNKSYSDAYYSLGLVYNLLGKDDKSIAAFKTVQQLNPTDKTIQPILDNLAAGKPIIQIAPTPTSTLPASATSASAGTSSKSTAK